MFPTEVILLFVFISVFAMYTIAKIIKICFKICKDFHVLLMCVIYLMFSYSLIESKVGTAYKYVNFRNLINTFWRNGQPSMPISHFFLCMFYKAQLDIDNPGYHGNRMSFWNLQACFAVWGHTCLTHKEWENPRQSVPGPVRFFFFYRESKLSSIHWPSVFWEKNMFETVVVRNAVHVCATLLND